MKIKDIEIISVADLKKNGNASRKYRRWRFPQPAFLKNENIHDWRPQKYSELYSDSFGKYQLFCNFSKEKGVVLLNQRSVNILNFCDGNRTIKDILKELSFRKDKKFKFRDAWFLKTNSFKNALAKFKTGEDILTLKELANICLVFSKNGLISPLKEPLANFSSHKKKFLDFYLCLNDRPYFSCQLDDKVPWKLEKGKEFKVINAIFEFARENKYGGIFIRFFAADYSEYQLFKELVVYGKRESMKQFISIKLALFTDWTLVNHSLIKDSRQMKFDIVLYLDGIGSVYNEHLQFLDKEGTFNEVEKASEILRKEKYSPLIISTITSLNINHLDKLTAYLLDNNFNFNFGFIQRHSSVPSGLIPKLGEMIKAMDNVYEVIEKKLPPYFIFQNILGRNTSLFTKRAPNKHSFFIASYPGGRKIEFKSKQGDRCQDCEFNGLCLKSFPVLTSFFSFEKDLLTDYCEVYKKLIPRALKLEAARLLKFMR